MKKTTWYILGVVALLIMSKKKTFANVVEGNQQIRDCDSYGCGHFGASRGDRIHKGIDVITQTGQSILAPIKGKVTRHGYPYEGNTYYKLIEIVNDMYKVKIMYVEPMISVGNQVNAGQVIAKAQNIAAKYSTSMTNHSHVEVYKKINGAWQVIDPTNLF